MSKTTRAGMDPLKRGGGTLTAQQAISPKFPNAVPDMPSHEV